MLKYIAAAKKHTYEEILRASGWEAHPYALNYTVRENLDTDYPIDCPNEWNRWENFK